MKTLINKRIKDLVNYLCFSESCSAILCESFELCLNRCPVSVGPKQTVITRTFAFSYDPWVYNKKTNNII